MFRDKSFLQALGNTFKLLAVVPVVTIALALILAFVIHQSKLPERGLYRTVLYFPNLVSMTVVGIIWSFVFHPTMGLLTSLMKKGRSRTIRSAVGRQFQNGALVHCHRARMAGHGLLYDHAHRGHGRHFAGDL